MSLPWILGKARLSVAKKAIAEYKKVCQNFKLLIPTDLVNGV